MATIDLRFDLYSLLLWLLEPFAYLLRPIDRAFRYAWDFVLTRFTEPLPPALVMAVDVGPVQLARTRSFLERRAARVDRFMAAGCPVLIAA